MNKRVYSNFKAISIEEYLVLDAIAVRLARKYPPDWLERQGRLLYLATLGMSFVAAVLVGLVWGAWWSFLIPLILPTAVLTVIPQLLFGRVAGRPRWAHRLAVLAPRDIEMVRRKVSALQHCEAISGDRLFEVWLHVPCHMRHAKASER